MLPSLKAEQGLYLTATLFTGDRCLLLESVDDDLYLGAVPALLQPNLAAKALDTGGGGTWRSSGCIVLRNQLRALRVRMREKAGGVRSIT